MDEDIYRELVNQDWPALYGKLVLYAHYRARVMNYPRRTEGHSELRAELGVEPDLELGLGQTVLDVVHTVIAKAFEGKRHWRPSDGPLLPWLKRQVDSEMDHLYQSKDFRTETQLEKTDEEGHLLVEMERVHHLEGNSDLAAHARRLEDANVEGEERLAQEEHARRQVDRLLDVISDDPELMVIFDAMMDGADKAENIARLKALPVEEVYRLKRKLRRRANNIRS